MSVQGTDVPGPDAVVAATSTTSKPNGKPDVVDDARNVQLSVSRTTSSHVYDAAEERHLQELALQFSESSPAAQLPPTASKLAGFAEDTGAAEESSKEQTLRAPPLQIAPAVQTPERASPNVLDGSRFTAAPSVTPITVRLIEEPGTKLQGPVTTPVTSLTSSVLATVSSLFGAPILLTATPPLPCLGSHGIVPQLQNIVATVNLCCPLDLRQIALRARNAEYNPRRFAAVIMRIREPRTTALLFRSGKIVCTGARSELQARIAARKFARIAQKLGYNAKFNDFKVQNIVASCDVGFSIKLESLALNHAQFSCYEPELFPGLVYRMVKPCILLLVFVSGKVVLTGAKLREDIYKAFENIYPILKKYQSM
ncbi:uncharacterized protein LOC142566828 [Dermacentor variabilis]|uniref:uncharacterized protein LOC142566828 n=1 Tax=Dermacentor variabilis TaxID=34621 RepID=UPI003F5B5FAE